MVKSENFGVFEKLLVRAKAHSEKIIVLPESDDDRIISAANMAIENNLCHITIIGDREKISKKLSKKSREFIEIVDNKKDTKVKDYYATKLFELRKHKGTTLDEAKKLLSDNIYFATMMVQNGDADGMVAGAASHTADVLRPAFQIIKTKPGILKASSSMIMEMPNGSGYGENGFMVFADCAVVEKPTSEELAGIAIASSETAKKICGMKPRVALLSFSTKANDDAKLSEEILRIKDAFKAVRRLDSSLQVDGELQADAAIEPFVAKIKCPSSKIAGKANVLVFPDLNSGNISYKLVQRLGGLKVAGPIIQGLNKPINDLSRSASDKEIFLTIALTVLQTV